MLEKRRWEIAILLAKVTIYFSQRKFHFCNCLIKHVLIEKEVAVFEKLHCVQTNFRKNISLSIIIDYNRIK